MELLERFAAGNVDAFETLFRQFQSEVYGWVVRLVRDPAAAEDVVLETFWRIYRSHATFDPRRSFGAWARRVATNAALSHLKASRAEAVAARPLSDGDGARAAGSLSAASNIDAAVRQAFATLPPKLRIVATLALIEEMPYPDIAKSLGISAAAVKSREFRAIRLLRKKLRQMGIEP